MGRPGMISSIMASYWSTPATSGPAARKPPYRRPRGGAFGRRGGRGLNTAKGRARRHGRGHWLRRRRSELRPGRLAGRCAGNHSHRRRRQVRRRARPEVPRLHTSPREERGKDAALTLELARLESATDGTCCVGRFSVVWRTGTPLSAASHGGPPMKISNVEVITFRIWTRRL